MIPIYEQGQGEGIGYTIKRFEERFSDICKKHIAEKRAKAFAFIFYDFFDDPIKNVLRHQGGFAQLDRLSGNELSIFYLHSVDHRHIGDFNQKFSEKLGIVDQVKFPCVVFFKLEGDHFRDVEIAELDQVDIVTALNELYLVIQNYLKRPQNDDKHKGLRILRSSAKFISVHLFDAALGDLLAHWF